MEAAENLVIPASRDPSGMLVANLDVNGQAVQELNVNPVAEGYSLSH